LDLSAAGTVIQPREKNSLILLSFLPFWNPSDPTVGKAGATKAKGKTAGGHEQSRKKGNTDA